MELTNKHRNCLCLAGIAVGVAIYGLPKLDDDVTQPQPAPTIIRSNVSRQDRNDYLERQQKEWRALFDHSAPDALKASAMAAEERFNEKPDSEHATAVKAALQPFYDRYIEEAQYEKAISVVKRMLELDGVLGEKQYWQDKSKLVLVYLRASQNEEARKIIDQLFDRVPPATSAQESLREILNYYLDSDRTDEALVLLYRAVRYDKEHQWPLYLGYEQFIRLAEKFEEKLQPTKAQEVFDLGVNVEVHRNQSWGQAEIMGRLADFKDRQGMKEQAEILRRDAALLKAKFEQPIVKSELLGGNESRLN